jgi:DNA-binding SARP family transcriptional activator
MEPVGLGVALRPASEPVLQARCLGGFAYRGTGNWQSGPTFKRGRELIQYLVSYPRAATSRDTLASIFWPDLEADVAAHRLHLAVTGARLALRQAFPDVEGIRYFGGAYSWNAFLRVESDAQTLLEASKSESIDQLRTAAALYNGEYLAGERAEWMYPLRVRYANAYAVILERLAENAMGCGNHVEAVEYALRLAEVDRAHEGATRLVMRSFVAMGRRGAALDAYDALAAYLHHHLALKPSAETIELREAIVEGRRG